MQNHKKVKDIMVDISDFPHIRNWFTIRQAIDSLNSFKISMSQGDKSLHHMWILVFDESYNLLGTMTLKDILKGLEPSFMRPPVNIQGYQERYQEEELSVIWDALFDKGSVDLAEKPVRDLIVPVSHFVEPDDPVTRAAYHMIRYDLIFMPVLEGRRKLVGVVRMTDVFDELSNTVINAVANE